MLDIGRNQVAKWSIGNSLTPLEGPRIMAAILDFSKDTAFTIDAVSVLLNLESEFTMVQTMYLDLSGTDAALTISVDKSGQTIIAKGRTQGYYPVVAPNLWKLAFACPDNGARIPVVLCNYPVPPATWAATA